jgi:hypothetical protein
VAALLRAAIAAVADLVVVGALEAAEQAALGVVVLVAGAPAQVKADVVQLGEDSVATADAGVGEACRGRLARSVTWQEPIEEPRERFTARKATVDVEETHADSGCSSSISKDVDDFIQLFYKEDPYLIDTAQDGVMIMTHFYGTTRTWAGGDRGEKLLLTQEDVLWVPEASGDLL